MTHYRQLFKSTGLLGSVQVLSVLTGVVRNKVAALFIGTAGIGLVDLFSRTIDLVCNATNFGLSLSAVRRLSEVYNAEIEAQPGVSPASLPQTVAQARLIRTWVLLTALLGTLICLSFAPLISRTVAGSSAYTASFMQLSLAVGFATLTGGEIALLRALRRLKSLAQASALGALGALVVSVPCYVLFGLRGIVPVLLVTSALLFALNLRASVRLLPYRLGSFRPGYLRLGLPLIKLGTAYILAGVMTSGAEMLIRAALMDSPCGVAEIGLYAAGYTLTVSYARIIFSAMDADFFPRLSVVVNNRRAMNLAINRQINVLAVLMSPFLVLFGLALPLITRILYTADFLPILPMVLCAAPCMFFKAIYTPIAYIPLARGDSFTYMVLELAYDVLFCALVVLGYSRYGLVGAGLGLSLAHLLDFFLIYVVFSRRYGYRMNLATLQRALLLLGLLLSGLGVSALPTLWLKVPLGLLVLGLLVPVVWPVLRQIRKR